MKAVVVEKPHHVSVKEIPEPELGPGEVLCRVRAFSFCGSDFHLLDGTMPRVSYPLVPGHEWAGEVAEVAPDVFEFKPGDRVAHESHSGCFRCDNCMRGFYTICLNYGRSPLHRHVGCTTDGGFAEYCVVRVGNLHLLPDDMSFTTGTLITTAGTCVMGLETCGVETGDEVVVLGAGSIGLLTAQFAKYLGARKTVVTDVHDERLEAASRLGIDGTINVKEEKVSEGLKRYGFERGPDLVVEAAGVAELASEAIELVRRGGRVLLLGISGGKRVPFNPDRIALDQITVYGTRGEGDRSCGRAIRAYRTGRLDSSPIVTHVFSFDEFEEALETFKRKPPEAIKIVVEV